MRVDQEIPEKQHIVVRDLCKVYQVPERKEGLLSSLRSLLKPQYREVQAVAHVSFTIHRGEMIGFIGPNGAGKTTTLKMLAGLLYPTSGEVRVEEFIPYERKASYLRRIGMVMGNKNNLTWENTVKDSFMVIGNIYRVPAEDLRRNLEELVELLEIEDLLPKLVRNLSLGERMKCELAGVLLYRPSILFLDEPTLGLDVSMQLRLRQFLSEYNRRTEATMIITSHYMADVTSLCSRVLLIHKGSLLYDGALTALAQRMAPFKLIRLAMSHTTEFSPLLTQFDSSVTLIESDEQHLTLRVANDKTSTVTARLLNELPVIDVTVEDPPIEVVIDQVYQEGVKA